MRGWCVGLGCVLLAGCGVKLPPMAGDLLLPRPGEVVLRRIDGKMWLAWRGGMRGDIKGWRFRVVYLEAGCVVCEPQKEREWEVEDAEVRREGGWRYVRLGDDWFGAVQAWVGMRLEEGDAGYRESDVYPGPAEIPLWNLHWKTLEGTKGGVRLFWQPLAGALLGDGWGLRANIYGRRRGESWSMTALNAKPLTASQWIWFPVADEKEGLREFTLRLVDGVGNEGPASPVVRILPQ